MHLGRDRIDDVVVRLYPNFFAGSLGNDHVADAVQPDGMERWRRANLRNELS